MKTLLSTLLAIFFSAQCIGQIKSTKKIPDILSEKHWAYIPKRVELVKSSLEKESAKVFEEGDFYISKFEVTTSEYRRFLNSLSDSDKEEHSPRDQNWKKLTEVKENMSKYYNQHAAFDRYPVVNVSVEDAKAFAEWLTEEYNKKSKRDFKQVSFRLPTESEWEMAARGNYPEHVTYPWGSPYLNNGEGKIRANVLRISGKMVKNYWDGDGNQKIEIVDRDLKQSLVLTSQVASFPKTQYDLYDMVGNVSEMTLSSHPIESGASISKGGSYALSEYWAQIDSQYPFKGSNPYTGFRLVMEVIEK